MAAAPGGTCPALGTAVAPEPLGRGLALRRGRRLYPGTVSLLRQEKRGETWRSLTGGAPLAAAEGEPPELPGLRGCWPCP